jgi:hypothetical protein
MDTRFWGPSGWQLLHLIAFKSENPEQFLLGIKDILPCRFCRESTAQYTRELPLRGDPGKWLYDLHNRINHKLRSQSQTDKKVIDPGPDPSFEEVKQKYENFVPTEVPGRDFLFSIATNYPDRPEPEQMAVQRVFLKQLSEVYPYGTFQSYMSKHPATLENRKAYMKWMYGLLTMLSKKIGFQMPTYNSYSRYVMGFKGGCEKKKYKGKTCRRKMRGGKKNTLRLPLFR